MKKTWLIFLQEYRKHVFSRRFLLVLLVVPLMLVAMTGLVYMIISMNNNTLPIGYVDQAGILADPLPGPLVIAPEKPTEMRLFADEKSARVALEAGEVQLYYVIPADYLTTGKLQVVHISQIKEFPRLHFYDFLAVNLLRQAHASVTTRILSGDEIIVQSADGSRQVSSRNGWINIFFPVIAALGFVVAMFTAGGYLMQAVVDEKENRTMEVLLTSVSPNQFMAGKILADTAVGLTQIGTWLVIILIGVQMVKPSFEFLQGLEVSPQLLLLCLVILLPTFVMVAAFMALVGATVSEAREGQQMTGLLSLPIWIPYMLIGLLIQNPNSPLAVTLSLLPLTSSLTMLIRQGVTILPTWQIALSASIVVASAIGTIWLAGRAFRLGMLRYGKRLAWRELFAQDGGAR